MSRERACRRRSSPRPTEPRSEPPVVASVTSHGLMTQDSGLCGYTFPHPVPTSLDVVTPLAVPHPHFQPRDQARNPNKIRHLRRFSRIPILGSTEKSRQNSSGAVRATSVRKDRRGRSGRCPVHWMALEIPVATRSGRLEPVACSSHPDLAPRGAVRKVGPRPDQTRSACTDEPGELASWPGDQS